MTIFNTIIDLSDLSDNEYDPTIESIESLTVDCGSATVESAYGAPEAPLGGCATTKYSGQSINLQASPDGAVGPYHVRFWRMPASGGSMSYGEIDTVRYVSEGSSTSTSFTLYDTDLVAASGKTDAGIPSTGATGAITAPNDSTAPLGIGKIRVATTVYDSCPVEAQSCISYCDVSLGCVAPTCNFTVI
jgi:hypothetical protein